MFETLTLVEDPFFQKGLNYEKFKEKAQKLLDKDIIKNVVCAKSFQSLYQLSDHLSEAICDLNIPGFTPLGEPYADIVQIIIYMVLILSKKIGLSNYCK